MLIIVLSFIYSFITCFLYPLRCSQIKNNVLFLPPAFLFLLLLKPFSSLGSRPFPIFWNRKKFVLPFPHFCSNLYRIFRVLDIKNFVQKSCISPAFSPAFLIFLLHFPLPFFTIFLFLFPDLNLDLSVSIGISFNRLIQSG